MANQPLFLPRQETPLLLETSLGSQSISNLSATNNSNLLAGQYRDVYIGKSRSELYFTDSYAKAVGS